MKNLSIKTLILDLDGPLLEGKHRHYQCYANILHTLGFTPIPLDQYWQLKRERTNRRVLLSMSGAEECYDQFLKLWLERIEALEYLNLDQLQTDVQSILGAWQEKGVTLILATMRHHAENLFEQLEKFNLLRYFTKIFPVGNTGNNYAKAMALKKYVPALKAEQCLWIGDTEVDVDSAKYLGMPIADVTTGLRTQTYLESLQPDYVCKNLIEINANIKGRLWA